MSAGCQYCGRSNLVEVHVPEHADVVAVVCLGCGQVQPVEQDHEQRS
jgi:transcription elongation factor Elf1